MEFNVFMDILCKKAIQIDMMLNEEQCKQFYNYMNLLIEWNHKINLTAIVEPEEIIVKHFIDSLTIQKDIEQGAKLVDVGTGAGFPGIPLKIVRPDIEVTLLDSLNKRILFLDEIIQQLHLEGIQTVHARVEEFGKNKKYRESFSVVTSRAVANLSVLSEYLLPLVKIGGIALCMKGSQIEKELKNCQKAIDVLGGNLETKKEFSLPGTEMKRSIIIIRKEKITPSGYPRKPGTPAKEPII